LNGDSIHTRCYAHILNLIVKDRLGIINRGIEKIKESVLYWTTSLKREEKFEENICHVCIPITKKLILDYPIRWNSIYLMVKTFLFIKMYFLDLSNQKPI